MQLTREWFYANMVSVHFRNIAKPFLRAQPITTMTVQYHFFNYVRRYIVVGNSWLTEHNKIARLRCAHLWRGSPPPLKYVVVWRLQFNQTLALFG